MSRPRYRAAPDRIGWALATGAGVCGAGAALIAWESGGSGPGGLFVGLIGAALAAVVIVGIGAPLWWVCGRRGPVAAGAIGAVTAAVVAIAILTHGFGLGLADGTMPAPLWISALATGAVAAFLGGLIALAMWLIAYRPVEL